MDTIFSDIISPPLIQFDVGSNAQRFTVHSLALSCLSQPLDALINGAMREGREHLAVWDDMEPAVFTLLVQYAYSGIFSFLNRELTIRNLRDAKQAWKDKKSQTVGCEGIINFDSLFTDYVESCGSKDFPQSDQVRNQSYLETAVDPDAFLLYMKLYVIADKYLIVNLRQAILYNTNWGLFYSLKKDILTAVKGMRLAIQYIFASTRQEDQMRKLLALYTARLLKCSEKNVFRDIMEESGEFSFLVAHYLQRIMHFRR
ncbi:hypothetical protein F5Y18DRAFT_430420 [Xylariaceae sp. FL1019]|nr:hypothetical protein F5Y18DRAFT_430420 [Xylariaceae sp. FL1019]